MLYSLLFFSFLLCTITTVASSTQAPDSVIVHGSRLNLHINGEYVKMVSPSGSEVTRNGQLVYRHECKSLYIFYVVNSNANFDTSIPTKFWIIGPTLQIPAGYAFSKHTRSQPQSISLEGYPDDEWKEFDKTKKIWVEDSVVVHSARTCDAFKITGRDVPENIRGTYVRDKMMMSALRPVYRRNVSNSPLLLHFNKYKPLWSISTNVNGRYSAMWLNADCATPDCGVNVKWWKPMLSVESVNTKCGPKRGLLPIDVVIKCVSRTHNIKSELAKTCGKQMLHKVGPVLYLGSSTKPGRWPWMAGIWKKSTNSFLCSASIISPRRILTAAHCYNDQIFVIIRVNDISKRPTEDGIEYKIRRVIKNPNYFYNKLNFRLSDDLMILELETDVIFDDYVQPLCIPNKIDTPLYLNMPLPNVDTPYTNCFASGWGQNANVSSGLKLLELEMGRMTTMPTCVDNFYDSYKWARTKSTNCVYFGKDSKYGKICRGDSGGPLYCQRKDSQRWTVIGVASWVAINCRNVAYIPSVYEDVSKYMNFINENMF